MRGEKLTCIVCGRKFPQGQGVVLEAGGIKLVFHSKRCALKFMRSLMEHIEPGELRRAVKETLREYEELLKRKAETTRKAI